MRTIEWCDNKVRLVDQTRLPAESVTVECSSWPELAEAIRAMRIRGAPALGVAGAMGVALAAVSSDAPTTPALLAELDAAAEAIEATRPTAVNLSWGVRRAIAAADANADLDPAGLAAEVVKEACLMADRDEAACRALGAAGAELIDDGDCILTHCNAGALACAAYGTALGVVRAAHEQGKKIHVFVDETRPLLQGARLTAWELTEEAIPFTLISDNMAGYLMQLGRIDKVIVGADRITSQGDVANKIGTYSVAVLAKHHGIPFYVAAPISTIDFSLKEGSDIPIEERAADEVRRVGDQQVAPIEAPVFNPAFDVTPHELVRAIITERGVAGPPYGKTLDGLRQADERS